MKKATITFLTILSFFASSCTKEGITLENNKLTNSLSQGFNDELRANFLRSGGSNSKKNHVEQADAAAALAAGLEKAYQTVSDCEQKGMTYSQIQSHMNSDEYKREFQIYVSAASQSASKKVAKNTGDCAIIEWPTTSTTYLDAYRFFKDEEQHTKDSIMMTFDIDEIEDLELPTNSEDILSIGMYHNGIIKKSLMPMHPGPRKSLSYPIDIPELDPDSEIDNLFGAEDFSTQYYNFGDNVDDNLSMYTMDYSSLLDSIPCTNNISKQIGMLFLDEIMYCNSYSDVLDLTNTYINIVESNNVLELYEKRALYACFVVATYSSLLWEEFIFDGEVMPEE
ncbi:MAG: hypothetical protein IJV17_00485 [Prevotella sp.]|nr:hypothetical protein [Prevotella sp.]